jgi:penicillin-binding protein 1A
VWFVGGTPDIVAGVYLGYDQPRPLGGWAQGGRISAPIWKEWAQTALKDQPKVPFVAPPGIRWVRIDRASGKAVFGVFPTDNDPKASVIWEAFQPQTEPRRSYNSTSGDPYNQQEQQQRILAQQQQMLAARRAAAAVPVSRPAAPGIETAPQPQAPAPTSLPTQNAL